MSQMDKYVKYFMDQSEEDIDRHKRVDKRCNSVQPVSRLQAVVDRVQSQMITNKPARKSSQQKRKGGRRKNTSEHTSPAWKLLKRCRKDV